MNIYKKIKAIKARLRQVWIRRSPLSYIEFLRASGVKIGGVII